jgi:hypothetical protein
MGIRDRPITPRSPGQNGHVELLIGSIRRACLDYVVVFGEGHLQGNRVKDLRCDQRREEIVIPSGSLTLEAQ